MHPIDLVIVFIYAAVVMCLGKFLTSHRTTMQDYFLAGRTLPWWAVMTSIVATETSTITLISVPGYSFTNDFSFLQIAFGYALGRIVISYTLLPSYFEGRFYTAYQFLSLRLGRTAGRLAAWLFLATRNLSDGLRLFGSALVITIVMSSASTDLVEMDESIFLVTIILLVFVTLVYTWLGGMTAVIWTDVIQMAIYVSAGILAVALLLKSLMEEPLTVTQRLYEAGKLDVFDFRFNLSLDYTFWSGILGGAFFTAASHGTDQMFVQRYLCCQTLKDAQRALIGSGLIVIGQFLLFLVIGSLLSASYDAFPYGEFTQRARGTMQPDRIFPLFIAFNFPIGLKGLMLAAIIAAAMSTLSSSLNSCAATFVGDIYARGINESGTDARVLQLSRWSTVVFALLQTLVAFFAAGLSERLIDDVLRIQFFTGGVMLGAFFISAWSRSIHPAIVAISCGGGVFLLALLAITTSVSWQWYTLIGSIVTIILALTLLALFPNKTKPTSTTS